jgi:hypothetical protein
VIETCAYSGGGGGVGEPVSGELRALAVAVREFEITASFLHVFLAAARERAGLRRSTSSQKRPHSRALSTRGDHKICAQRPARPHKTRDRSKHLEIVMVGVPAGCCLRVAACLLLLGAGCLVRGAGSLALGAGCLALGAWCLELGAWGVVVFGARCSVLGAWC